MNFYLPSTPKVLVQGITGKEGRRAVEFMRAGGTEIVAGVTPGKGGQQVAGIPVYNSVAEAFAAHPELNLSSLYVPPRFVKSAFQELAETLVKHHRSDGFFVHLIAEGVPLQDTAFIIETAKQLQITVLGPASIGLIKPGHFKIGSIGGLANGSFRSGSVAILSKSGGLSSEAALIVKSLGFGQSLVAGLGGDVLIGSIFSDFFPYLEQDPQTRLVILIGEVGGTYEQQAAQAIESGLLTKPVIGFVSGLFTETLPQGVALGHAGALIEGRASRRQAKLDAFKRAGIYVADTLYDIGPLVNKLLK